MTLGSITLPIGSLVIVHPLEPNVLLATKHLHRLCHPEASWPPAPNILVARADDEVIGYAGWMIHEGPPYGKAMYNQDTAVHPSWRGKGVGHLLMEERLEVAQEEGCRAAFGITTADNRPMVALLEGHGYRFVSEGPWGRLFMRVLEGATE